MAACRRFPLLVVCLGSLMAAEGVPPELELRTHGTWVRSGRPLVVEVVHPGLTTLGPATIAVTISDERGKLGAVTVALTRGDQMSWPMRLAVVPERASGPQPRLEARLSWSAGELRQTVPLQAPADLALRPAPPALAGWAHGLLAEESAISLADLERIASGFPGWSLQRDPIDGSWQPLRDQPAPEARRTVLLLHTPSQDDGGPGGRWPSLPLAWRQAALAAGVTIREIFPGGDRTWSGPGPRRVPGAAASLTGEIVALAVAPVPASAAGKVPVIATSPQELADPATWRRPGVVAPAPPSAAPLMAWSTGPVTVVVGTGEHRAAASDNHALADALSAAWWQWSRGLLARQTDERALPATGNLVLIGSPRSNRHLARLLPEDAPVAWTERTITVAGRTLLRPLAPALAGIFPRPGVPGAWVLVLDGAWRWGDLPLAEDGPWAVRTE